MSAPKLIDLIEEKRFEEARKIIKEADDKEALISDTNDYDRNALHKAISYKAPDDLILEMIGAGGAAVFWKDYGGKTPLHNAVYYDTLDQKDNHGQTPRYYLCQNKLDERSKMLVKNSTSEILMELWFSNEEDEKEERITQLEKEVFELKQLLGEEKKKTVDAEKRNEILQQQTRSSKEELIALRQSRDKINAERTEQVAMKEEKIVELSRLLEIEKRREVDMNKWGERVEQQIAPLKEELLNLRISQKNVNRMMEIVLKEQMSPMREQSITRELLLQSRFVCFLAFMTFLLMVSFYRILE